MAKSLNKVQLIGNVGKDPEVKFTPSGTAVAKFGLATNERFKDKSGEWQDRTEWHNSDAPQNYFQQSGEKKYRTEVIASDLLLLSGRGESSGSSGGEDFESGRSSRGAAASASSFDQRASQPDDQGQGQPADITDDDIPF